MSNDRQRERFLRTLGERVRGERARRGMSRRLLARHAGISERYVTQLESGKGNVSIALLNQIATALGLPLARLFEDQPSSPQKAALRQLLERLSAQQMTEAYDTLSALLQSESEASRSRRIALVGLRGAGKSTLGRRLAASMELQFFELDREIEILSGLPLAHLLELSGQAAYRRYEMQALQNLLEAHPSFVVATGGSIVSEPANYELLLRSCFTVWMRTSPEEHMARVIAQGDERPMAGSPQAMEDLRRILHEREPLYARADLVLNTSGRSPSQSLAELIRRTPPPARQ